MLPARNVRLRGAFGEVSFFEQPAPQVSYLGGSANSVQSFIARLPSAAGVQYAGFADGRRKAAAQRKRRAEKSGAGPSIRRKPAGLLAVKDWFLIGKRFPNGTALLARSITMAFAEDRICVTREGRELKSGDAVFGFRPARCVSETTQPQERNELLIRPRLCSRNRVMTAL